MHKTLKPIVCLFTAATLFITACGTQPAASPMQTYYNSLAATQATLRQLSGSAQTAAYKSQINSVIASYNVAEASFQAIYAAKSTDTTALAADTALLVDQVALLVATFAPQAKTVRFSAKAIKTRSVDPKVSLNDILTILTIAAAAAQGIPAASPYAVLASLVLQAADAGVIAYKQASMANVINASALVALPLLP